MPRSPDATPDETHSSSLADEGTFHLRVLGPGIDARHALPPKVPLTVGRDPGAAVAIAHPSVSRGHAELVRLDDRLVVTDLGSRNGTFVAGARIEPARGVLLLAGSIFRAGDIVFLFEGRPHGPVAGPGETRSAAMKRALDLADRVAPDEIPVLIVGETGVGKEVLAERIHARSPRARGPLLKLNVAALSPSLVESELFGHERGAFTGAVMAKPGLLPAARGGTILLDEIGEIEPALQVKLLRVLEDRLVLPVGGHKAHPVDVRFLAATHRDLRRAVREGTFREDLYYRLSAMTIAVPPLRDRVDDLDLLAESLLARACRERGRAPLPFTERALAKLRSHTWPGNIRELRNVVVRALLLSDGPAVDAAHVEIEQLRPEPPSEARPPEPAPRPAATAEDPERARIVAALTACHGNQKEAAKQLGISRRTLLYKLDAHAIPRPRKHTGQ